METSCGLVPEYDPGCDMCGGKRTYNIGECVFICRDGKHGEVADVYTSIASGNVDHPADGARSNPPTWALRSICEIFIPNPIVEGATVTETVDEVTGQITYTVASEELPKVVSDITCDGVNQTAEIKFTDDSSIKLGVTLRKVNTNLPGNTILIDPSTAVGALPNTEHDLDITAGDCGTTFAIENYMSIKQIKAGTGDFQIRPQIQIDGGSWENIPTGGVHEYGATQAQDLVSEISHASFDDITLTEGAHNIKVRYFLVENNLADGAEFSNGQTNFYVTRAQLTCC